MAVKDVRDTQSKNNCEAGVVSMIVAVVSFVLRDWIIGVVALTLNIRVLLLVRSKAVAEHVVMLEFTVIVYNKVQPAKALVFICERFVGKIIEESLEQPLKRLVSKVVLVNVVGRFIVVNVAARDVIIIGNGSTELNVNVLS